jgi:hypothetical protein
VLIVAIDGLLAIALSHTPLPQSSQSRFEQMVSPQPEDEGSEPRAEKEFAQVHTQVHGRTQFPSPGDSIPLLLFPTCAEKSATSPSSSAYSSRASLADSCRVLCCRETLGRLEPDSIEQVCGPLRRRELRSDGARGQGIGEIRPGSYDCP